MNRKKFIESQGASCDNFSWSWSFVNHQARTVIFGAWDRNTVDGRIEIFGEDWQINEKGHKRSAYGQSRRHIRLLEEEAIINC